jgi:hypothetical protein
MLYYVIHHLQDVVGWARILGNLWDREHAKIHQDLGHIPHQGRRLASLDDTVHLSILKQPLELNELHQLIMTKFIRDQAP